MDARSADLYPVVVQFLDGVAAGAPDQGGDALPSSQTLVRPLPVLPAVVKNAKGASIVTTVEGQVLDWNPGAQRLYGYAATEILRQSVTSLVAPERREALRHMTERLRRGEGCGPIDTVALRADGRRVDISMTISPVRDDAGRVVAALAVAHELSERIRVREELQRAWREPENWGSEERLPLRMLKRFDEQCACRIREREAHAADFAAIVAHELASPIAAIRYLTSMVMMGGLRSEEQADALATIRAETEVLQALVTDMESALVSECKEFAVRLQPIAVTQLMAEPITFARTLPGEHPLTTLIDIDDEVLADPQRVGQVLRNLIGNAMKYSPPGAPVELRATRYRSRIRIEVADRGPGIQPDDRRRIFEKFERGHAGRSHREPGLGLGLYLSRRLVQMHGSELTVAPRPGGGSIFGFELEVLG